MLKNDTILDWAPNIVLHSTCHPDSFAAINIISGDVYRLNGTSWWIVQTIRDSMRLRDLKDAFMKAFDSTPEQCDGEIVPFLRALHREHIIDFTETGGTV